MNWAVVFPIRQIEAKQELGKSTKYRHHRTKFKYLSIIKVLTKLSMQIRIDITMQIRKCHLLAGADYRQFAIGKQTAIEIIR